LSPDGCRLNHAGRRKEFPMTRRDWHAAQSIGVTLLVVAALGWWLVAVVLAVTAPHSAANESAPASQLFGILVSGQQ
jgi:hypothetical protein